MACTYMCKFVEKQSMYGQATRPLWIGYQRLRDNLCTGLDYKPAWSA